MYELAFVLSGLVVVGIVAAVIRERLNLRPDRAEGRSRKVPTTRSPHPGDTGADEEQPQSANSTEILERLSAMESKLRATQRQLDDLDESTDRRWKRLSARITREQTPEEDDEGEDAPSPLPDLFRQPTPTPNGVPVRRLLRRGAR